MLFPEIVENPALSAGEKVARLRDREASIRNLERALCAEDDGENPWLETLAEIENKIRNLASYG